MAFHKFLEGNLQISNDSDVSMDTSSNHSQEGNGFKKVDDDISTTDSDSSKTALNSPKGGSRKFIPKTIFSETFAVILLLDKVLQVK